MQMSHKPWVNRILGAIGYSPIAPSLCWYYRHVISHHPHTNDHDDVDVQGLDYLDALPPKYHWLKPFGLPFIFLFAPFTVGIGTLLEIFAFGGLSGHYVSLWIGQLLWETIAWFALHFFFGPSCFHYLCMWFSAGTISSPCRRSHTQLSTQILVQRQAGRRSRCEHPSTLLHALHFGTMWPSGSPPRLIITCFQALVHIALMTFTISL